MILVTGATGKLGTAVIQTLLGKTSANQIAALVRDESKASSFKEKGVDVRVGHYDDIDSLKQAMQGVEKVLLIAGTDEENRVRQHQNVINAAKKAGVGCVAYTSRTLKDRSTMVNKLMEGHFQTEDDLKASGVGYAIFRNVLYMDALPQFVGEKVFETGIHSPVGQGKVPYALRSDMGEAIANWLVEGHCENKIYHLTGSEAYSFDDIATTLSTLSGKEVKYTPVEVATFGAGMKERGVPEVIVGRVIGFLTDIKNGQEEEVSSDLENLLGRKPTSLHEGLEVLFNLAQ
jgi:NAD(P)H dehydrogenase (quinone)